MTTRRFRLIKRTEVDGPASTSRDLTFSSTGKDRWIIRIDSAAESGSNAGSDLRILRRADDGSALGNDLLVINRATGEATFAYAIVAPYRLLGYTVAGLPAGTQGDIAFVTDASAPVFLTAVVGGGAVITPVFHNGTTWVAG